MNIKFRAWDKVCREMFYSSELSNGDILVLHLDGRIEISDDDTYKPEDFVLMQCTGLCDKNGCEIYEGDIVKVLYNRLGNINVKFDKGRYNISDYKLGECVVIGNIYEGVSE